MGASTSRDPATVDVLSTLQVCLRRWYVVVPLLAFGIVFAVLKFEQASPVYQLSTKLIVLSGGTVVTSSNASSSALATNPYASQISTAAEAATVSSLSPEALRAVASRGPSAAFGAAAEQSSPIIDITASSPERGTLSAALANFVLEAGKQFRELQLRAGSPPQQLLQLQSLSSPGAPAVSYPRRSRTLGTMVLGSLVLAAIAGVALDAALGRRHRPRRVRWVASGSTSGEPDAGDTGRPSGAPLNVYQETAARDVEAQQRSTAPGRRASADGDALSEEDASQRLRL